MRILIICKTFSILIIVFHSRAYSTFRDDGASSSSTSPSSSAFSYDAELKEAPVLGPDGATLSMLDSHEAESQGSLVASGDDDDMSRVDSGGEENGQADSNNGGRTEEEEELIRNGNDECTPTNRRNRGKMRVRQQLFCPVEPLQNSQEPATGQRIKTAPPRRTTVQPVEMPETEPYIPLQFLKPDEETCLPAITGKGHFFSAPNTPVCSTGLDQINFPLAPKVQYATLQECFPCESFIIILLLLPQKMISF